MLGKGHHMLQAQPPFACASAPFHAQLPAACVTAGMGFGYVAYDCLHYAVHHMGNKLPGSVLQVGSFKANRFSVLYSIFFVEGQKLSIDF